MSVASQTSSVIVDTSRSPFARQRPLPVDAVHLNDAFWAPRIRTNREVTLPSQHELLEQTGRLDNFRRAAGTQEGRFEGLYFNDTDVYKWLEAASWALASEPDPTLDRLVDAVISEVAAAQQPDGYLDTYYIAGDLAKRWTELPRTHELYCAGHLFQAAVAHYRATGKSSLLAIARRFADHICDVLGPASDGKRPGTDGHPEIEMALVELARATGERRYLEQARYFLDVRGQGLAGGDEYRQDHRPFRELDAMVGHAVRALYLAAGATDILAETGDQSLLTPLERLWLNMTTRRVYLTGGAGSRHEGEAFGNDFELPNARAYAETCAAIGSVMWNWRMLLLTGATKYADLLETTLYNAVLPGISLDGQAYFYENPLADEGGHRRQPWFECACCPPNIARLIASVSGYFYSISHEGIHVHLYGQGTAECSLGDGQIVRLRQTTNYPWDGEVELEVDAEGDFALFLRIPSWCEADAAIHVNGHAYDAIAEAGTAVRIQRNWQPGDHVHLKLPMPVQTIEAHPFVVENTGRIALRRGPIVYCLEGADHPGIDLREIVLPRKPRFTVEPRPDLLGGVVTLRASAMVHPISADWHNRLYRTASPSAAPQATARPIEISAIPYYAWANRAPGHMLVWIRQV